jgi:hypothetical protein
MMSIIERLKELERKADEADAAVHLDKDPRIQQWRTIERFEFLYNLEIEWPKLMALIDAFTNLILAMDDTNENDKDNTEDHLKCVVPGCMPSCHPSAGCFVKYKGGVLETSCAVCGKTMVSFKIADR